MTVELIATELGPKVKINYHEYTATREISLLFQSSLLSCFLSLYPEGPEATLADKYPSTAAQPATFSGFVGNPNEFIPPLNGLGGNVNKFKNYRLRLLGYPSPQDQREVFRDLRRLQQDSEKRIRASGIELKLFLVATKLES